VFRYSTRFNELRKVMGTSKHIDPSAAFLFEVPGSNSPLVVQELQIGGTRSPGTKLGFAASAPMIRGDLRIVWRKRGVNSFGCGILCRPGVFLLLAAHRSYLMSPTARNGSA
jgi:hypothetical protein